MKCEECQGEMECVGMDRSKPVASSFSKFRKKGDEVPESHWHDYRIYETLFVCPSCGRAKKIEYMEPCPVPDCEWNEQELVKNLPKVSLERALKNSLGGRDLK